MQIPPAPPDTFFQDNGHVVTGAISLPAVGDTATPLLSVPGGIVVSVTNTVGSGLALLIGNPTSQTLHAIVDPGTGTAATDHDLSAGPTPMAVPLAPGGGVGQVHIQILPNALVSEVVTIIVSADNACIVGQAFSGPS